MVSWHPSFHYAREVPLSRRGCQENRPCRELISWSCLVTPPPLQADGSISESVMRSLEEMRAYLDQVPHRACAHVRTVHFHRPIRPARRQIGRV